MKNGNVRTIQDKVVAPNDGRKRDDLQCKHRSMKQPLLRQRDLADDDGGVAGNFGVDLTGQLKWIAVAYQGACHGMKGPATKAMDGFDEVVGAEQKQWREEDEADVAGNVECGRIVQDDRQKP